MRPFALGVLAAYLVLFGLFLFGRGAYDALVTAPFAGAEIRFTQALLEKLTPFPEWCNQPQRNGKRGVTIHDESRMWGDLTLVVAADSDDILLVNPAGETVHAWHISFAEAWPGGAPHVAHPVAPAFISIARAYLDPARDGGLVVEFVGSGDPHNEYGRVRLDKDSRVTARWPLHAHHDLAFLPGGEMLTFMNEVRMEPLESLPEVEPPFLEEFIARIDGKGSLLRKDSLTQAMTASGAHRFFEHIGAHNTDAGMRKGDLMHPNGLTPVPPEAVGAAPMLKENRALLSFRNLDMLAIIDLATMKVEWAAFGPWRGQHTPRFLPNGHIVMFDNHGNLNGDGGSRVIEVDLATSAIVWEYGGTAENPIFSPYNGRAVPLPNGNILVTESMAGRIFEVTRDKEIVWEYHNPRRRAFPGDDTPRIGALFSGARYRSEDLPFLKTDKE